MKYIDGNDISNKRVILRVDFNVSLNPNFTIADDVRIRQAIPTIELLLKQKNKIILITHLGRPEGREEKYSLQKVAKDLETYIPGYQVKLISDFLTEPHETFMAQEEQTIILLENIRFYTEEQANDPEFAKKLAALGDIYVNDAFSVSHRADASIVGIPALLPSYAGLLLKKEITMLQKAVDHPEKPVVTILGGSKISSKINLITKLCTIADTVILGGGIANTFLAAQGYKLGKSLVEEKEMETAKKLMALAEKEQTTLLLPHDVVVSEEKTHHTSSIKGLTEINEDERILDLGPATLAQYGQHIATAKTIIWNGPVGYFENPAFRRGTDFTYYAITQNPHAFSVVGGGETLAAIENKEYLDHISHISTGGGAMLEFIENGTLPGIEALK